MNDSQRQSISHAIKAVLSDVKEFDVKFKHPFNLLCTGPSQSGKSRFVKTLLHKREIEPFSSKVILTYKDEGTGFGTSVCTWPGRRDEPGGWRNPKPTYIRRPTA